MSEKIFERLETSVLYECDVLVCGGGFGGISAALAAAREGKRVILLERGFMLGGLATAGLVTIFLAICDGKGKQVSFGIAEELLRLSVSIHSEGPLCENWLKAGNEEKRTEKDRRFESEFNAQIFAIQAEKLLEENGVKLLYGTYAVAAPAANERIQAVIAENKSGRFAIKANAYVDATGDCDLAYFSGTPTEKFQQGNVLAAWYYRYGKEGFKLKALGCADIPEEEKGPDYREKHLVSRRFTGLDGEEVSEFMSLAHEKILEDVLKIRESDPTYVPTTIATVPQLRMTRKIGGEYTLSVLEQHTYFEDSIGMVSDWKHRGPVWEVPFRTLYSAKMKNLICAGRITSVTEALWDVMRVIPCCCVTGQAAGTAAALTDDFTSLDVSFLQARLKERGVRIHETEL